MLPDIRSLREQAASVRQVSYAGTIMVAMQHEHLTRTILKRMTLRHDVLIQLEDGKCITLQQAAHLVLDDEASHRRIVVYRNEVAYDIRRDTPRFELIETDGGAWTLYDYANLQPSNEIGFKHDYEGKFL